MMQERRRDYQGDGRLGRLEERVEGLQRQITDLRNVQTWQNRFAIGTLVTAIGLLVEAMRHP